MKRKGTPWYADGLRFACTIYEARPIPCRTFPFWPEHLDSPAAWRELAGDCPGVGSGPRHGESEILHQLAGPGRR